MAFPEDAPHYHGRVVTVNPSTGRYTGLTATDPLYVNTGTTVGAGAGSVFEAYIEDTGATNAFETDQAVTDTPTLYLTATYLAAGTLNRIHVSLTPANAVTPTLYIFSGAQADDKASERRLLFSSAEYYPSGLVSGTEYDFIDLQIPFVLDTANRIYYALDWSGAPGNTTGYLAVLGVRGG